MKRMRRNTYDEERGDIKFVNGVEASPIALLVQTANRFSSSIYIESGDKKVNVKSIMGMMSLAMNYEDMVTVVTEGEDEKEALDTLEQFLSEG